MKQPDWIKTSDDFVERLVTETNLLDGVVDADPLVEALRAPQTGHLRKRIEDDRYAGGRKFEGQIVEEHLGKSDVTRDQMAANLGVVRTTIDRALNGKSISNIMPRLRDHYRDELMDLDWPTRDRISIEGYCHAVRKLEADLRKIGALQQTVRHPLMNDETFCYLWHTLSSVEWQRAHQQQSDEEFDRSATLIHQRVIDPRVFPTCQSKFAKPRETIKAICRKWDVSFYLVVVSSVDVIKFQR